VLSFGAEFSVNDAPVPAELLRVLRRIDLVLDDNYVMREVDEDIDTPPFAPDIDLTEIHQIGVEQGSSLCPAVGKDISQEFSQENVTEPVIFAWVNQKCEEVGMPDFLPFNREDERCSALAWPARVSRNPDQ